MNKFWLITFLCGGVIWGWAVESLLGLWFLLEFNFLIFIPLLMFLTSAVKVVAKYFLVQAVGSGFLLLSLLAGSQVIEGGGSLFLLLLLWKLGGFPFYTWFLNLSQEISWEIFFFLSSVQKLLPLYFLTFLSSFWAGVVGVSNVLFAGVAAFGENSLKAIFAFSSIFTLGWSLVSLGASGAMWLLLILNYMLILGPAIWMFLSPQIEKTKGGMEEAPVSVGLGLVGLLLVMGGVPPFLGFFLKTMIILGLTSMGVILGPLLLVLGSVVMLYAYTLVGFLGLSFLGARASEASAKSLGVTGVILGMHLFWGIILFGGGTIIFCMSINT